MLAWQLILLVILETFSLLSPFSNGRDTRMADIGIAISYLTSILQLPGLEMVYVLE